MFCFHVRFQLLLLTIVLSESARKEFEKHGSCQTHGTGVPDWLGIAENMVQKMMLLS